jgi:hypothetical protein
MMQQSAILVTARKEGCTAGTVDKDVRQCILPGQSKQQSTNDGGKGDDSNGEKTMQEERDG